MTIARHLQVTDRNVASGYLFTILLFIVIFAINKEVARPRLRSCTRTPSQRPSTDRHHVDAPGARPRTMSAGLRPPLQRCLKGSPAKFGFDSLVGMHLPSTGVLSYQLFRPHHKRRVYPTKPLAPLTDQGRADIVFTVQLCDRNRCFMRFQKGLYLAVGKSRLPDLSLLLRSLQKPFLKISIFLGELQYRTRHLKTPRLI